jgi:hypothetical protein
MHFLPFLFRPSRVFPLPGCSGLMAGGKPDTTKQLVNLLELKQKQANFLEAVQSRRLANVMAEQTKQAAKQATQTAEQTRISNKHLAKAKEQLVAMKKQADGTEKQSKTVMVFTVVTIIFVRFPLFVLSPQPIPDDWIATI